MIHAVFEKQNGRFCYVSVTGHAGFAEAGKDIVCASVSSAVQYATILITETFHEEDMETDDGNKITVRLKAPAEGHAFRILEGLWQHLTFLSEDYPGTITIKILEV